MKFRKKPVVIEAMLVSEDSVESVLRWVRNHEDLTNERFISVAIDGNPNSALQINTLEGAIVASYGDWIIKDVQGEFYPCKPDIFSATYEPVYI